MNNEILSLIQLLFLSHSNIPLFIHYEYVYCLPHIEQLATS